ncbi:uncharacterized protein LOC126618086 [Malus sylvestris]|uniref:uncharacterized protein LOC126618086 n=1 Tax=Malus sylvestris TaxID=3752 RepID=UPI0021ACFFBD|nr:uncharacterized protein LOC126618086 [Malus sylvestris]
MGDIRRRSLAMQMTQYQASHATADAKMNAEEAEFANSLIQYQHHAESSHHGFVMGCSFMQRDREECHDRMMKDYFIELVHYNYYFARKIDVVGRQRLSLYQKLTYAFRMLANGCSANSIEEYCQLVKSTAIKNLKRFCKTIEAIYGATYLSKPNREDLNRFLRKADKRGFTGMIGSLNCMHWEGKNCPTVWAGQFKGRHNKPTIVLKVVASYDTWIWHAFFDAPGSNNDINVLWSSPLFEDVVNGWAPE